MHAMTDAEKIDALGAIAETETPPETETQATARSARNAAALKRAQAEDRIVLRAARRRRLVVDVPSDVAEALSERGFAGPTRRTAAQEAAVVLYRSVFLN